MTRDAFIELVQNADFLEQERREELIDSSEWLLDEEMDALAQQIEEAGQSAEKHTPLHKEMQVEHFYEVIQEFKEKELPKLVSRAKRPSH